MPRVVQHLADRTGLDQLAAVHDRQLLADLGDHRQVMSDEDQADPGLAAEPGQQPQDLVLDRHVERGGRLVAQDDLRLAGQRDRDHYPLAHAAGELVRIGTVPPLRIRDADPAHQVERQLRRLGPADAQVDHRRLGDLAADPHHRVERAHRFLEDHRHLRPADPVQVGLAQRHQILSVQQDLSGSDPCLRRQHAEDGSQGHALAGAGLPDQPERVARGDLERHSVHCADHAAAAGDLHMQIANLEHRRRHDWPGRSRSARPSPIRESPSPTMITAIPGIVASCQCVVRKSCPSLIIDPHSAVGGGMARPK